MQRLAVIIAILTANAIWAPALQAQTKDDFEYWDLNENGDLTCTEATGKDEGLKLPAYRDNRDGTGMIYQWLERRRSSDADNDGIACDSTSNPNGYVPRAGSTPPPTSNARKCPDGSPTWMGLPVCEEGGREGYARDEFGSASSSLEDEIIDALPKSDEQVYTPYTCTLFEIRADGTAATDIEHIVALAEAYDSGLAESQFRTFAGDMDNLTIADPTVNRHQKSDLDAGEWEPSENRGWFASRVVTVKKKYGLSVNATERDALQSMIISDPSRTITCGDEQAESGGQIHYFPHLAVGAGWQTTLTYINYTADEVSCRTDFLSDQGTPLMVSFPSLGPDVRRSDMLPPGGSVHEETDVGLSSPPAAGWARATCSGPVKASLLFRQYDSAGLAVAEAGVNAAAAPATRFVTFAEQAPGQPGTGVAYANPSDTAARVTFTARNAAGRTLDSFDQTLMPGEHGAKNMTGLFDLPSFTGSLEITSTEPIVTLSINAEAAPIFSSLPPGELDPSAQGPTTYYFPHLAVGASWQTTITYINYSSEEVSCRTDFLSSQGTPLIVSFPGRGRVDRRTDVLPPGGSVHEETDVGLSAPAAAGWARATCSGPVKASLLFRQYDSAGVPTGEAGVNAAAVPSTRFVTFAEQAAGQPGTGVAYANPSDTTAAVVTFTVKDAAGRTLDSVDESLMPKGHVAKNMAGLFDLISFSGSLEITSTEPIVILSLNAEAAPVFSSLPPGELDAADIPGEIPVTGAPDLVVQAPSVSADTSNAGESFTFSATVRNQGQGPAAATTLRCYRSSDTMITTSDMEVAAAEVAELVVSGSSSQSVRLTAPATPGKYYYGACVDAVEDESTTANNCSTSVLITVSEPQSGTAKDREALLEFYHLTGGPDWIDRTNWLSDTPLSDWFGVDTDGSGRVTGLNLSRNQLSGSIPPQLADLISLQVLDLSANQLSGQIPPVLSKLISLQVLDLSVNQLSGQIPPVLSKLTSLQWLELRINQLSGSIPPALANLTSLQRLHLGNNQLSGSIPPELANLTSLRELYLGDNQLSGSIPPELANLTGLQWLSLLGNELSGSIPPELANLTSLRWLELSANQLSESIPPELANLTNLRGLDLWNNHLSGSIPPELGDLARIITLDLSGNQLSGSIPPELANLTSLLHLNFSVNQLSGMLPWWLQQLPLKSLNLMATSVCVPADAELERWLATIEYLPSGLTCGQSLSEMSTIDVALFYTPAARRRAGGAAEIEAAMDLLIAETNRAYEESGVDQQIVLVARKEVQYVEEDGSVDRAMGRFVDPSDGYMDEIHAIRDQVGADLVQLIAEVTDGGGAAYKPGAFSLIRTSRLNTFVFAHELGHNMGLSHDRPEAIGALFPYSYGYVNQRAFATDAATSARWRTIMAYPTQCSDAGFGCNWILRFSNPNQSYLGDPLGVPGDERTRALTGPADAVRALNRTRHSVAAFRKPSSEKRLSMFGGGSQAWSAASMAPQAIASPGAAVGSVGILFEAIAPKGRGGASLLSGDGPDPTTLRRREVTVDIGLLDRVSAAGTGTALTLNLFDDFVLFGVIEKRRPTFSGGYALSGRLAGVAGGSVTLVINGSVVAGSVRLPTATYRIRPAAGGRHAIIQVDPSKLPQGCETLLWPTGREQ